MLRTLTNFQRLAFWGNTVTSRMGSTKKIGTHNGTFHCDEVLACSMLKHAEPHYKEAEIVRSRDMKVLNDCDIVVDVGGVYDPNNHRYDHHQRSFTHTMNTLNKSYPWKIKLSSAGLVYFHFGQKIISNILQISKDSEQVTVLYKKIYESFVQEIDAIDNGVEPYDGVEPRYKMHTSLSSRVKNLNPAWNDFEADETQSFKKASLLVEEEFLERVNYYGKIWWPAREIVKSAIEERKQVHSCGEIIELTSCSPWKEHLFDLETSFQLEKLIKFVIYSDTNSMWRIQCVPVSPFTFENRLSLKEEWCGLRDEELSKISGIPDCIFVHANGFIGGNKTREGAIKMALKTLGVE